MSKDLLKEAIADAKAVRETAIANAKIALEEAFTPKLQSMLSQKIAEDMEDDLDDSELDEINIVEDAEAEEDNEDEESAEDEVVEAVEDEDEEALELESIIKELEDEEEAEEELDESQTNEAAEPEAEEEEEIDLDEIIKSLQEDADEEEAVEENNDLEEAYKTIQTLKDTINEVNLLNSKLLFSNKLFRSFNLSESQKMNVIETFDRANSVREVKLVYSTLAESLTGYSPKKQRVAEGFASKATKSTKPSKDVIVEANHFSSRMQRLAGLK